MKLESLTALHSSLIQVHRICFSLHMASAINLPLKVHFRPSFSVILPLNRSKLRIQCSKKRFSDAELAADLATEVAKINTQLTQTRDAMKKGKELLFSEVSGHFGLKSEAMKGKWRKMGEDEKWALVKKFVSEWSDNFQPLSARSVKEMVDEFVVGEDSSSPSSASILFPGLQRLMGFSENK